jgi:hypothetical protein
MPGEIDLNAPKIGPPTATRTPAQPVILLTSARQKPPPLTANQQTDAHTALTRGLAQYLRTLSTVFAGGRDIRLVQVGETWAEPEAEAVYPSACVFGPEPGHYDASRFSPEAVTTQAIPLPDGRYIIKPTEFIQDLVIEVWCTDNKQRMAVCAMIENGLNATNFMYGIKLVLPHYFNTIGVYSMKDMVYIDSPEAAKERIRIARFIVGAAVPVIRLSAIPGAQPRVTAKAGPYVTLTEGVYQEVD